MGSRNSRDADDDDEEMNFSGPNDFGSGDSGSSRQGSPTPNNSRPPLEPRRHQGAQPGGLEVLIEFLYRSGHMQAMSTGRRAAARHLSGGDDSSLSSPVPPDTTVMDKSDFKLGVLMNSGLDVNHRLSPPYGSVPLGMIPQYRMLRPCEKVQLMQGLLPNRSTKLLEIDEKLFCGLHSQDGNVFLTAGQDQQIQIFDTTRACIPGLSLKPIRHFDARDVGWSILDVRLSTCGKYLAYSSWSDSIHIATVHSDAIHDPVHLNPTHPNSCGVFSLMFSHDDTEILGGVNQGDLYICSLLNGHSQRIEAHADDVNTVAFADSSSQILYSGSDDGFIKVWDRRILSENNPKACGIFIGHQHGITFLDPHEDGRHVISNGKDQCIKLWDLRRFSPVNGVEEAKRAVATNRTDYRHMRPKPASKKLASDTSVMTYTGHQVSRTLIRARFSPFESTASRFIYSGDYQGNVYIFDALTGAIESRLSSHAGVVRDVSWHPSRPEIISSSWDGCQLLWTYSDGEFDEDHQIAESASNSDESG